MDDQDDDKEVSENTPLKRFGLASRRGCSSQVEILRRACPNCCVVTGNLRALTSGVVGYLVLGAWCTMHTPKKQKLSIIYRKSDEIGFSNEMVGGIKMSIKNGTFSTHFRVDSWDRQGEEEKRGRGEEAFVGGKDIVVFRGSRPLGLKWLGMLYPFPAFH